MKGIGVIFLLGAKSSVLYNTVCFSLPILRVYQAIVRLAANMMPGHAEIGPFTSIKMASALLIRKGLHITYIVGK